MATFKVCVRKMRKDGFYPVYIRVTHDRKIGYIKTDKLVNEAGLHNGEVQDAFVMNYCTKVIMDYVDRLNRHDTRLWQLSDIIKFLEEGDADICFSDYARKHRDNLINEGRARSARNYELAFENLERFLGTNKVMFSQLTSTIVNLWIGSLMETKRAKEMYPVCVREIFRAACKEFNDYDTGMLRIRTNPWMKVKIPKSDTPEKQAITPQQCREFFGAPLPESKFVEPLPELARDVAMMILCLGGINTVDIYRLQKKDYYDGVLHYNRAKTKKHRTDGAYMEMRVPPIIAPLLEKYKADEDDSYLFIFHKRHSSSDSFNANVNIGIRAICESMGMDKDDFYHSYTFRHTWATTAQNYCGASLSDVSFGLNHSHGSHTTRGYVKFDFSPAWELNEKVVELIFFTEKSAEPAEKNDKTRFEKFSPRHMIHGTVYFMGRTLGEVQDIGFNNVDDVIKHLIPFVPDEVPNRSIVQFKIENCDKNQVAYYERMKGKGF